MDATSLPQRVGPGYTKKSEITHLRAKYASALYVAMASQSPCPLSQPVKPEGGKISNYVETSIFNTKTAALLEINFPVKRFP